MTAKFLLVIPLLGFSLPLLATAEISRSIPQPLTNHPGNVFLAGEEVAVSSSLFKTNFSWRLLDYERRIIARPQSTNGSIALGKLPVGYFELRPAHAEEPRIALAVLAKLAEPTPKTSPIGVDVAMAQFHSVTQQSAVANLCALAGMNWVRDRFLWRELQPEKNRFAESVPADATARAQADAGLRVLQVVCDTPAWAGKNPKRFPNDLRDAFRFMKSAAERWRDRVFAFEPWNEADTPNFGGHIGSEIAAFQKACYLGLKAGNPNVIVCQNIFASPQPIVLADFNANEISPFFDTFNFHHYCPPEELAAVYAAFRPIAAGKPIWVSEFNLPLQWSGDGVAQELDETNLRLQAERVAQVFATTLNENPAVAFYFMLSHFAEGQVQYGVLRKDLTPRPAFVALAAVGRILADAKPLGRMPAHEPLRAFAFRSRPDGEERDVIVAWTTSGAANVELPIKPLAVFDHLGRAQTNTANALKISTAPLFVICQKDSLSALGLRLRATPSENKDEKPSQIVLQIAPSNEVVMSLSAYRCSSAKPVKLPLFAYNFGDAAVSGNLSATVPSGWKVEHPTRVELAPGERKELFVMLDRRDATTTPSDSFYVRGDFGTAGETIVSWRMAAEPFTILREAGKPLRGASDAKNWQSIFAPGSDVIVSNSTDAVLFRAKFPSADRWIFPVLNLDGNDRGPMNCIALAARISVTEGAGNFRVIFEEENGSAYFSPFYPQPKPGESIETLAMFDAALHGEGWSQPDDNRRLDPEKIRRVRIGCNAESGTVAYELKNVRWVTPRASR